jgi:hypothetical protein
MADGQAILQTLATTGAPATVYGALAFFQGTWAVFLALSKALLIAAISPYFGDFTPGFTDTSNLVTASNTPPQSAISQYASGALAHMADLNYP